MRKAIIFVMFIICIWSISLVDSHAGNVIIASDDWIFTNIGFASLPVDTTNFALNVAGFLTNEGGQLIHAYSDFQSLAQSSIINTLNNAGYTYTTGTGITFDLPTLSQYDALFLGSTLPSSSQLDILSDYVSNGGGLYIHGGLGQGNPGGTALVWNNFLSQYNLAFGSSFMGLNGPTSIISSHRLFDGVSSLYMEDGHTITGGGVIATTTGGSALFAASEVPIPAAIWLFGSGFAGLIYFRRKTRK